MLRRKPTRIELSAKDISEYERVRSLKVTQKQTESKSVHDPLSLGPFTTFSVPQNGLSNTLTPHQSSDAGSSSSVPLDSDVVMENSVEPTLTLEEVKTVSVAERIGLQ